MLTGGATLLRPLLTLAATLDKSCCDLCNLTAIAIFFSRGEVASSVGPGLRRVVQEMLFKDFALSTLVAILISGGHFVKRSKITCAMLVEGIIMGTFL